jgi:hypothetical protein
LIVVSMPALPDAVDCQQQGGQQPGAGHGAGGMLAAAEAAGRRAFGERLEGCAGVLQAPYRVVQPQVVAVEAADIQLGLQPGSSRTVPSGNDSLVGSPDLGCMLRIVLADCRHCHGGRMKAHWVHLFTVPCGAAEQATGLV